MRHYNFLNLKKFIIIITKSLWDFFGFLSHFNALKFSPGRSSVCTRRAVQICA